MIRFIWLTACAACCLVVDLRAQEKPQPSQEQLEKALQELATPGEEHKEFKAMVGDWKAVCKSYEADPNEPVVTEASATFRLLMGGRYLQQRFTGEFGGQKFTGMGITAYDKAQKKYTGVWIDNMSTGIMHTTGERDDATGTMTETAEVHGPFGPVKMRMVSRHKGDDAFTFTMYMLLPDGTERKQMEIEYTRIAKQN